MDYKYVKSSKIKHNSEASNLLNTLQNNWQLPAIFILLNHNIYKSEVEKKFVIVNINKVYEKLIPGTLILCCY